MNKLSRLAAKGWLLDSFAFLGIHLRKGEPKQLTYCVDYNDVRPSELSSYLELFEVSGWTKVCSNSNIYIFSAAKGTVPIYTDTETKHVKYKKSMKMIKPLLFIPLFTAVMFAILLLSQFLPDVTTLKNIFITAGALSLIVSVPILMTYISFLIRLNRVK